MMPCVFPDPGPPRVKTPRAISSPLRQNRPLPKSRRRLRSPQNAPSSVMPSVSSRRKRRYSRMLQKCDEPNAPRLATGTRKRSIRSRSQPPSRKRLCRNTTVNNKMKMRMRAKISRRPSLVFAGAPTSIFRIPLREARPRCAARLLKTVT